MGPIEQTLNDKKYLYPKIKNMMTKKSTCNKKIYKRKLFDIALYNIFYTKKLQSKQLN